MRPSTRAVLLATVLLLPMAASCSETVEDARSAASSVQDRADEAIQEAKDKADEEIQKAKDELAQGTEDLRVDAIVAAVGAAAPAAFSAEGYDIDGDLTCTAESPALDTFSVSCTGTTTDGGAVEVAGERPEDGSGSITGSVDGTEVFDSTDCFGLC
jgi:hypothetical protein